MKHRSLISHFISPLLFPQLPLWILLSITALVAPCVSSGREMPKQACLLVEDDSELTFTERAEGEPEKDEIAPQIPTKRPPRADEVGPKEGELELQRTTPLPGLPVDSSFDTVSWIPEGPVSTINGDLNIAPLHPTSGCVTAIAPHPTDQNIIYIGTANGGVWRTNNALATNVRWKPLTDNELSLSIGGLAIDPNDASGNTLVAGIGRRSSYGPAAGGALKGLLRTTDGGTTWTRLGELPAQLAGNEVGTRRWRRFGRRASSRDVPTDSAASTIEGLQPTTMRDRGRGAAAVEAIRRGGGTAEFLQADFSSLQPAGLPPGAVHSLQSPLRNRDKSLVGVQRPGDVSCFPGNRRCRLCDNRHARAKRFVPARPMMR